MNDLDTGHRLRVLTQAAALPADLDAWLAVTARLHQARRRRTKRRIALGAAIALCTAAAVTAFILISLSPSQPVNAATIARRAAAVLRTGAGLPPVELTQVTTTAAGYGPATPLRVVEHIAFAAPDRWRDTATITLGGRRTRQLTTVRNGDVVATVSGRKVSVASASGQGGSLFETSVVGQRLAWASVLAAMGTGRCAPSLALNRHGPLIEGEPTLVLHVGPARCPSNAAPETDGPATFWLDARTYLVLRADLHGPAGHLAQMVRVTALRYRPSFPGGTFIVPTPSPSTSTPVPPTGTLPSLAALRNALAYGPLLPRRLPDGLRIATITPITNGGVPATRGKLKEFTITYDNRSGQPVMQLYEAPSSSPSIRLNGKRVLIRPGLTGTASTIEGLVLWWIQDGRYCSLQTGGVTAGVQLGRIPESKLIHTASSFS